MFGKLKFWKKDPLDFDAPVGGAPEQSPLSQEWGSPFHDSQSQTQSSNMGPLNMPEMVSPTQPSAFQSQRENTQSQEAINLAKNMELVSSKLDTVKAMLDNLSQRMAHLEDIASAEEQKPVQRYRQW